MSILNITSISELHALLGFPKPKHPLISLIDTAKTQITKNELNKKVVHNLYMISLKDKSCGVEYGRNSFDFNEGVMIFTAPGQTYTFTKEYRYGEIQGWMLYFHPDLLYNTSLGQTMDTYSFFNYDVIEALHLSEDEESTMNATVENIVSEYEQRIDNHSQKVIVSNLELLLSYALRYYERQFNTRTNRNKDIQSQFEIALKEYFQSEQHLINGLPDIQHFADLAHYSKHYFSDLIKKETGRTPKDHINAHVIEKAKQMLLGSEQSVSEIAYDLGFNYPHYFSRLFKKQTGESPSEFRNLN